MAKEREQATGTHLLKGTDGGRSQNGKINKASGEHSLAGSTDGGEGQNDKRNRMSDGHSLSGEPRRRKKSEWQKKQSD
jgi:hypothetical protein